ncbi:MAG TPA: TIGR03086 family metal-binding protein [Acidimicrobiia bacterium]|nr:TIGR03086 family metal-binding protein [Acidimicrobiia bacterium]
MSAEVLRQAFASTGSILRNVSAEQLDLPTPCASWTVRDLVNHIVGGTTYFAVTAETGTGTAPPVGDADHTAGDFKAEFEQGAERAVKAFSADGAMEKVMTLPFGELPGSIFVLVAANDTFTHGWDLATATGQPTDLDPALAARLLEAAQFIPDEFRGPDGQAPFGPKVDVPEPASAADKLAGFMGRQI